MKSVKGLLFLVLALFIPIFTSVSTMASSPYPAKPTKHIYIQDYASMLSSKEDLALYNKLEELNHKKGIQFAIVTVEKLPSGYNIEDYSNGLFRYWGIGDKKTNRGLLLLYSRQEDKIRMEVGYGLEGELTDAKSKDIIVKAHKLIRQNKSSDAFVGVINSVDNSIISTPSNPETPKYVRTILTVVLFIALFLIVLAIIAFVTTRHSEDTFWHCFKYLVLGIIINDNYTNYSGSGDDDDGGFFGGGDSFGGGSSGGGGASD